MRSNCTMEIMLACIHKWTDERKITTSDCSSAAHSNSLFSSFEWVKKKKRNSNTSIKVIGDCFKLQYSNYIPVTMHHPDIAILVYLNWNFSNNFITSNTCIFVSLLLLENKEDTKRLLSILFCTKQP